MKRGLLPATTFVRIDLAIEIGQLIPKQTSIITSKILILLNMLEHEYNQVLGLYYNSCFLVMCWYSGGRHHLQGGSIQYSDMDPLSDMFCNASSWMDLF